MKTEAEFTTEPDSLEIHHLAVAVDSSPASRRGLELAADVSRRRGAHVTVVHVRHLPAGTGLDFGLAQGEMAVTLDEVESEVRRLAAEVLDGRGIEWDMQVREGSPGVEVLGSTTAYLTSHSPVPVLVARHQDNRPSVVQFRPRSTGLAEPAIRR
jgi:nucleotide-binding universal stress UspA family protein